MLNTIFLFLIDIRNTIGSFFAVYLPYLKAISFLVSLGLLVLIIWLMSKTKFIAAKVDRWVSDLSTERLYKRRTIKGWQSIQAKLKTGLDAELKLALIDADKLLDETIKMIGYRGETMADRLKQLTPAQLSNIQDIWNVHKFRNRIVHETEFTITKHEAEKNIVVYEKAFKELGLLD